jgi:transcription initiation factor TFIIIB Brf1 subunit/transcription initiation factor TFIIB
MRADFINEGRPKTCEFCGNSEFVQDSKLGDMICTGCAVALQSAVDFSDETRLYSNDSSNNGDKTTRSSNLIDAPGDLMTQYAFNGTEMHEYLQSKNIKRLLVGGLITSVCAMQ